MWDQFLIFINSNSALWNFLVTIATTIYVFLTYKLLNETVKSRKLQNRPYIIADMELKNIYLKMVVKNIGTNSALNVKIIVQPEISNPFTNIKFLAPNREISNVVSYMFDQEPNETKITIYKFIISYEDAYKFKFKDEYTIDISPLLLSTSYNEDDNKAIVEKLDKMLSKFDNIKNELHDISSASNHQADYLKDIKGKIK